MLIHKKQHKQQEKEMYCPHLRVLSECISLTGHLMSGFASGKSWTHGGTPPQVILDIRVNVAPLVDALWSLLGLASGPAQARPRLL